MNYKMQKVPKCRQRKQAIYVCDNEKCSKNNPFICCTKCECVSDHTNCYSIEWEEWERFSQLLNQELENGITTIKHLFDEGIKKLQQQKKQFETWIEQQQILKTRDNFFNSINKQKQHEWNGNKINKLKNIVNIFNKDKINHQKEIINNISFQLPQLLKFTYTGYQINNRNLQIVNEKLQHLRINPENLTIKFGSHLEVYPLLPREQLCFDDSVIMYQLTVKKFPQNLKRLKNIRVLTIYYSDAVLQNQKNFNNPYKTIFSDLCQALSQLPKLQKFKLIVQAQVGKQPKVDFQKLGDKFQFEIKKNWWETENWR